ncbi:MAG: DNA-3-methyladenine glycosylase 2 family protein [Acidobacteria bacterium]|nr:DNA-3-methyladenine glycosylase 2 family protein [Acidobacteriota bacterium]
MQKTFQHTPGRAAAAVEHLKSGDPVLNHVIRRIGDFRIEYREPAFETLVRSIVFQQLSGKVARVIFERLERAAGGRLTPESILKLRPERMRRLGLSGQKTAYIRDLARRTRDAAIVFEELPGLSDAEVIERLTAVKGIGVWTAQMFLIFALGRWDVLPAGDLGIRSAIRKVYGLAELPAPREVEAIGERWRPYCSVASWYLWRSLDGVAGI